MTNILAKDNGVTLKQHTEDILENFSKIGKAYSNSVNNIAKLIEWAIKLHDLGKVLPYFQIRYVQNKNYEPFDVNDSINIYHSLASVLFINTERLRNILGEEHSEYVKYVLSAIAYHHWKKSLEFDMRFGSDKFEYLKLSKYLQVLETNLFNELKEIIGEDKEIISVNMEMLEGLSNGISFAEYVVPPYQIYWLPKRLETKETKKDGKKMWILISGFLQRCDHFASFCEEDENKYDIEIKNIELKHIKRNIINEIRNKMPSFGEENLWQNAIIEHNKDNLIVVAPTGCGKTELAFLWSFGQKIFYTLPLRSAAEQIYERAQNIFGIDKTALLHSDADVYLLGYEENWERIKTYEVAKQLAYPVIISTGDQFFPYGLRPPGYERIYATFSYSRLVIDEVQAYDPKAAAIIIKFIEDISRLGGKFLLMTATLPSFILQEIEKRIDTKITPVNLYEERKTSYEKLVKHRLQFYKIENKKSEKKTDFSIQQKIINEIIIKAQDKRVLVICNTIKQANDVYKKIKSALEQYGSNKIKNDNVLLFHSQFTLNEKNRIKNVIETKFKNPKPENDSEGMILVATQVVEASLDLDADVLYTEICPMDALIQRMGRVLRRHKENFKLKNSDEPNVFVLVFENGLQSGQSRVYHRELIEKTLIAFNVFSKKEKKSDFNDYYKKKELDFKKITILNSIIDEEESKNKKRSSKKEIQYTIDISEYDKFKLNNNVYKELDHDSEYLKDFYTTLDVLDAGFISDRKEEAQRIFREILNVSVIDESQIDNLKKALQLLVVNKGEKLNYTIFKRDIVANFVIQIPYYDFIDGKICSLCDVINQLKHDIDNDMVYKKLYIWSKDIYIVQTKNNNKYVKLQDELTSNVI